VQYDKFIESEINDTFLTLMKLNSKCTRFVGANDVMQKINEKEKCEEEESGLCGSLANEKDRNDFKKE